MHCVVVGVFCFKQKTAYEMRISDWSSDVCSSDLWNAKGDAPRTAVPQISHVVGASPDLVEARPSDDVRLQMKLEAEQTRFGAGYRVFPEHALRDLNDTLGPDRFDAEVERSGFARCVDAGLYEPHIFLENRVLGRDPEREDAVEPALDRRPLVEQGSMLLDKLQACDDLEFLEDSDRKSGVEGKSLAVSVDLGGCR